MTGSVAGTNLTNGIVGEYGVNVIKNVCAASTIQSGSDAYCICSRDNTDNITSLLTKVIINGTEIEVVENQKNGSLYGINTLHKRQIYEGLGFDFENVWAIDEGNGFPYIKELGDVEDSGSEGGNEDSESGAVEIPSTDAVVYIGSKTPTEITADLTSILANRTILQDNSNALMYVNNTTVTETMTLLGDNSADNKIVKDNDNNWAAESIQLTDAQPIFVPADVHAESIKYTRTFTTDAWQALYLPFEMQYEEWADKAKVAYINDVHQFDDDDDGEIDRTMIEFISVKRGSLKANTPYVIKPLATGDVTFTASNTVLTATPAADGYVDCSSTSMLYTITGTYQTKSDIYANGQYAMAEGDFMQAVDENVTLAPFRIYLDIKPRNGNGTMNRVRRVQIMVDGELTTGIGGIEAQDNSDTWYDMQGRRAVPTGKGLYIHNGKKYLIK